jgi:DNA-binding MarR family transcriptional regulator
MDAEKPAYFDANTEALAERIAVGLSKLGLAMKQQTWTEANERGVSPTQAQIVSLLSFASDRSASELAAKLGLTLPTISDSVNALAAKGLISKHADPERPRVSLLRLTADGKRLAKAARSWPDFLASAAHSLSPSEQEGFLLGLIKIVGTLQAEGQIPTQEMCVSCIHFKPNVHKGEMPHHCAFVDAPMAIRHLRLLCNEHQAASSEHALAALSALRVSI